jgi:S-adenosylmethionine:diacylglycerol 3-amino-3-carboxypropyl transferase
MNAYELANEIFSQSNGAVKDSHYVEIGDALVRVSNHLPRIANILAYNENVKRVFLVLTDATLENQAESICEEIASHGIDAEYTVFESSDDVDYIKMRVSKFLSA